MQQKNKKVYLNALDTDPLQDKGPEEDTNKGENDPIQIYREACKRSGKGVSNQIVNGYFLKYTANQCLA